MLAGSKAKKRTTRSGRASAPRSRLALQGPQLGSTGFHCGEPGGRTLQRPQAPRKAPNRGLCAAGAPASRPFRLPGQSSRESLWSEGGAVAQLSAARKPPAPRARPAAGPEVMPGGRRRPGGLGLVATTASRSASGTRPSASRPTLYPGAAALTPARYGARRSRPGRPAPAGPRLPTLPSLHPLP